MRNELVASLSVVVAAAGFAQAGVSAQEAPADFFRNKTVTILVGLSAGGDYDLYARLVARPLGRHIPGRPAVIVRNQPGAGGRTMLNRLYAAGPHDGTAIGLANQGVAQDQALGDKGLRVDSSKLAWLGSP